MNILILNWRDLKHPEAGGAEIHLNEIFKRLVKRGHTVVLLTTGFKGSSAQDDEDGITVYRRGHTYTFNWEAPFLIRPLLKKHAIDCIIDDVNKIPFFTPRWFPRVPSGAFFHHLFGSTVYALAAKPLAAYVLFLENLSAWGYRNVPCCTVSRSTAEELGRKGFDAARISIIENSVDTNRYCPDASVRKENNLLLYTGRLKRYKNVEIIFEAMKRLRDSGIVLQCAVAGSGDDESFLVSYASRLGMSDQVCFYGHVTEEEKIDLYRRAIIFVNPSRKEGWGITNIEANACGTAVIANNAPGLRDSVRHDETGFLYRENDPDALAAGVRMLLDNPVKRAFFEHEGRMWAQGFSWDRSADKVEQWLRKILSEKHS